MSSKDKHTILCFYLYDIVIIIEKQCSILNKLGAQDAQGKKASNPVKRFSLNFENVSANVHSDTKGLNCETM